VQNRLISLLGIVAFIALGWALSNNRRVFPWRAVLAGLGLQFAFALFILKTPTGVFLFLKATETVGKLNDFAMEGARMVFGALADSTKLEAAFGPGNGAVFAILVSATIILISALSALL